MKLEDIEELDRKVSMAKEIKHKMEFLEEKIEEFSSHTDDVHKVIIDIGRAVKGSVPSFAMTYVYPANDEFLNECVLNMFRYSLRNLKNQLEEL